MLIEIRTWIEEAHRQPAVAVNIGLTLLYWRIGRRIHREVLGNETYAEWFSLPKPFPGRILSATLSRQLSWFHFSALLPLSHPFQREFYAEMCRIEGWSVRILRERINSILYGRTALSKRWENPSRLTLPRSGLAKVSLLAGSV